MNLKYYWADRNALAVRQGRGVGANRFADLALAAHSDEQALTLRYNTQVAGGKWDGYINPYPSQIPKAPGRPTVTRVTRTETSGLGVAAEGNETGAARPLLFSAYSRDRRFVDVFNTGFLALDWTAEPGASWLRLNTSGGSLTEQTRVWVEVDWERAPEGTLDTSVVVTGGGRSVEVPVRVVNDGARARRRARGSSRRADMCRSTRRTSSSGWHGAGPAGGSYGVSGVVPEPWRRCRRRRPRSPVTSPLGHRS